MIRFSALRLVSTLCLAVFGFVAAPVRAQNAYWSIDAGFAPVIEGAPGIGGVVLRAAYPGGRLLVGTSYTYINGVRPASWLARLNTDGSLDGSFLAPGAAGEVLAVYPDGKVLCGIVPDDNPSGRLVVRLLPDGTSDAAFSPLAIAYSGMRVRLLPDQRLIVAGSFTSIGGVPCRYLARLLPDGSRDSSFVSPYGESADVPAINSVELAADGEHILIAGGGLGLGAGRNSVARLAPDGSIDGTFNTGALEFPSYLQRAYPQADGSVVVADGAGALVKLTATGTSDPTFAPTLVGIPLAFGRQQADGAIYYTTPSAGGTIVQLRRLTASFQDDPGFAGIATPYASAYQIGLPEVLDDGSLIVGATTAERQAARHLLTRVAANGTLDATYHPRFSRPAKIAAQALQPDGRLLLAGAIDHVNGVPVSAAYAVVRLQPDGSQDTDFAASLPAGTVVTHLSVRPDGRILVLGNIPAEGGPAAKALYLTNVGGIDTILTQLPELAVPQGVDAQGRILTWQSDASPALRRWLADGTPDPTFAAPATLIFSALVPLSDGRLLVVETGSGGNGTLRCLTEAGSFDPAFVPLPVSILDYCGAIPMANGEVIVCTREHITDQRYALRLRRISTSGSVIATYTTPSYPGKSIAMAEVWLPAIGLIYDWFLVDNPEPAAHLQADLTRLAYTDKHLLFNTEGLIYHLENSGYHYRYRRTAASGPSFDPGPFEVHYLPVRTDLVPINARFEPHAIASGLEPFTYAWLKDGQPILNATGQQLVLTPVQATDAGVYAVQVSNAYGSATGSDLNLTIDTENAAAWVSLSPASQTAMAGTEVTFSATVLGNPAPTFQWYFNGNVITGAEEPTLTIPAASDSSAGTYYLRARNTVANAGGTQTYTVFSAAATLVVTYLFDTWREERFTPLELADATISGPAADPDGDGFANLVEYALGLAPNAADTTGLPTVTTDATHWIYTYTRPVDRPDVTCTAEVSTNLTTWIAPAVPATLVATDGGIETWQAKEPLTAEQAFFRLKVTQL